MKNNFFYTSDHTVCAANYTALLPDAHESETNLTQETAQSIVVGSNKASDQNKTKAMIITQKNNDRFYLFFCFLFFSISSISKFMLDFLHFPREMTYILLIAAYIYYFVVILGKIETIDILYYIIVLPTVSWGIMEYGQYINIKHLYTTIIMVLPAYIFFRHCPIDYLEKGLIHATYINMFYTIADYHLHTSLLEEYDMSFGYELAIASNVLFYKFLKKKNYIDILLYVVSVYYALIFGSRGALVFALLTPLYYVYSFFYRKKGVIYCFVAVGALIFFVSSNFDYVLDKMIEYFPTNRSLRRLEQGDFLESKSRDLLYDDVKRIIRTPNREYGAFASRKQILHDPYPHSLLYELQIDFGNLLGMCLFSFIIFVALYNLYCYRGTKYSLLAGVYCLTGIGTLFVSSTLYISLSVPVSLALFFEHYHQARIPKTIPQQA